MKKILMVIAMVLSSMVFTGCFDDAEIAKHNLSKAADNFEIQRRVVFYNGITDTYMLEIIGKCSIQAAQDKGIKKVSIVCKKGPKQFYKHDLRLSDNISYFSEQLKPIPVNVYHTRITFKPQQILPDVDFRGDAMEAVYAIKPDKKD